MTKACTTSKGAGRRDKGTHLTWPAVRPVHVYGIQAMLNGRLQRSFYTLFSNLSPQSL